MERKTSLKIATANTIISLLMITGLLFFLQNLEKYIRITLFIGISFFMLGTIIFLILKKEKESKSLFSLNMLLATILVIFFILNMTGLFEEISDIEHIKNLILKSGTSGIIICFLIIVLNVILLPAPNVLFYLGITAVYGPLIAFLICYLGTIIGSVIAFSIARKFGKRLVIWCFGKEDTEKYSTLLSKKGNLPFLIMQFFPFFPDDILCMVAGLSNMSYKFLTLSIVFVRPFYIMAVCFLGTGEIIPFNSYGLIIWGIIFIVVMIFCIFYFKNQDKIDNFLSEKFVKK